MTAHKLTRKDKISQLKLKFRTQILNIIGSITSKMATNQIQLLANHYESLFEDLHRTSYQDHQVHFHVQEP